MEPPTDDGRDLIDSVNIDPRGRYLAVVVDNDGPVRRAIARSLRFAGCEVLEADALATARARYARHGRHLSVVITEVVLTDGNGVDFAAEVRAENPGLPVVYTSGYDREALADHAAGPLEPFLPKPFTPQQVMAAVFPLFASP